MADVASTEQAEQAATSGPSNLSCEYTREGVEPWWHPTERGCNR